MLLRYERLVATFRRPYLRPLMRTLGAELRGLLHEVFSRSGISVDARRLEQLIALVDGAVVNALIEVDPDPARSPTACCGSRCNPDEPASWVKGRERVRQSDEESFRRMPDIPVTLQQLMRLATDPNLVL